MQEALFRRFSTIALSVSQTTASSSLSRKFSILTDSFSSILLMDSPAKTARENLAISNLEELPSTGEIWIDSPIPSTIGDSIKPN